MLTLVGERTFDSDKMSEKRVRAVVHERRWESYVQRCASNAHASALPHERSEARYASVVFSHTLFVHGAYYEHLVLSPWKRRSQYMREAESTIQSHPLSAIRSNVLLFRQVDLNGF